MCGIVGYIGNQEAYPILIKGLKRLEYRGYDSAGVALLSPRGALNVYKAKGKVSNLEERSLGKELDGSVGIAHTRWATHGEPSEINAHPHYAQSHRLAIVHNGIIENYKELQNYLLQEGYSFVSETDTEVLAQWIEYVQKKENLSLFDAVRKALCEVMGAYAIAVLSQDDPHTIVVARKSSPLVVGIGKDYQEFFIGSDATPIVEYTRQVVYVGDDEVVRISLGSPLRIENLQGEAVEHTPVEVSLDVSMIEKGGYPHFMLKEIFEQPQCLKDCMKGRVDADLQEVVLSSMQFHGEKLVKARRMIILGCGTSWHAGLIGKQLIEKFARIPVEVEYASEFRYRDPIISSEDVVIAISQSGETADTLAAIMLAKERGACIYSICNVIGASIPRMADTGTYIHVGPEIGVASTKAFTGQITVLAMLALTLGKQKGTLTSEKYHTLVADLAQIPSQIETILQRTDEIREISNRFTYAQNFIYLGRGFNYPVALEGALKLKELSYIHAEGYPAAEMKHGPIALIDENMPIVMIATKDEIYDKMVSNIQEVKARKGCILAVVNEGDEHVKKMVEYTIEVPASAPEWMPILAVIPLQLLSYYVSLAKGKDVDQPRNLAKSVTVE